MNNRTRHLENHWRGERGASYGAETAGELIVMVRRPIERRRLLVMMALVAVLMLVAILVVMMVVIGSGPRLALGRLVVLVVRTASDTWHETVHKVREASVRLAHYRHPIDHI